MPIFGLFEAKTQLSALVERAARGEEITITKHGQAMARLIPVHPVATRNRHQVAARMRQMRSESNLEGVTIRQLIEEGRRF
jgi:prevent-host-death family protein